MTETARKQRTITSDKVDSDSPAAKIVDKFGGLTRFCEICEYPTSTVYGWMKAGLIASRRRDDGTTHHVWILAKAAEHSIELGAEDFIG